jgi:hypothetical protein
MNTGSGNLDLVLTRLNLSLSSQRSKNEWNGLLCDKSCYAVEIKNGKERKKARQNRFSQLENIGDAILALALTEICLNRNFEIRKISQWKSNQILSQLAKHYDIVSLLCEDPSDSMEVMFGLIYAEKGLDQATKFIRRLYSEKKIIPRANYKRSKNWQMVDSIITLALRLYCLQIYPNGMGGGMAIRAQALSNPSIISYIVSKEFNNRTSLQKANDELLSELYFDAGFEEVLNIVTSALPYNAKELKSFVYRHNPEKSKVF